MRRFVALLVFAGALGGCVETAPARPRFDSAAVAALTPGMSEAEVVARVGRPSTRSVLLDGRVQLSWANMNGLFAGSAGIEVATVIFGADGKLVRSGSEKTTISR